MNRGDRVKVIETGVLGCGLEGTVDDFIYDKDLRLMVVDVRFDGGVCGLYFHADLMVTSGGNHDKSTEKMP